MNNFQINGIIFIITVINKIIIITKISVQFIVQILLWMDTCIRVTLYFGQKFLINIKKILLLIKYNLNPKVQKLTKWIYFCHVKRIMTLTLYLQTEFIDSLNRLVTFNIHIYLTWHLNHGSLFLCLNWPDASVSSNSTRIGRTHVFVMLWCLSQQLQGCCLHSAAMDDNFNCSNCRQFLAKNNVELVIKGDETHVGIVPALPWQSLLEVMLKILLDIFVFTFLLLYSQSFCHSFANVISLLFDKKGTVSEEKKIETILSTCNKRFINIISNQNCGELNLHSQYLVISTKFQRAFPSPHKGLRIYLFN